MALREAFSNGWREPVEDVEWELESFSSAIDRARHNSWCDADVIGEQLERFLAAITRQRSTTWRELSFLGSPAAQLPRSSKNNWREPLDLLESSAVA
jgi:hypothetical protein